MRNNNKGIFGSPFGGKARRMKPVKSRKYNWEIFEDNSSTRDALFDFIAGMPLNEFYKACWPRNCKRAIKKLKGKVGLARTSAKRYLLSRGYDKSDFDECWC